jgi:hypothetical protein
MSSIEAVIRGPLSPHPRAQEFAQQVLRVHTRYASEVVFAFGLCPFMKEAETAFGRFYVMLDHSLDVAATVEAVTSAASPVVHVVFPCANPAAAVFEKFASALGKALREAVASPPVMAAFHPDLSGDRSAPHRLVGLLRRAPDPFVQFVPEGLHEGGTVFAGLEHEMRPDPMTVNFTRLRGEPLDRLFAIQADVRADRDRSYAPYLEALRQWDAA